MSASLFRHMLKNPRTVGALAPSSAALGRAVAEAAKGFPSILELVAGTGAITRELLKLSHKQLEVVEIDDRMAQQLRLTLPTVDVQNSCAATALNSFLPLGTPVVVSSLPFKSLPLETKRHTIESALSFLTRFEGAEWVQFTYGLRKPFDVPTEFCWLRKTWVLKNVPPACVWVLAKRPPLP